MSAMPNSHAGVLALRSACTSLRLYFRHAPGSMGKQWLWDRVVRPHILWRSFRIEARTLFGAKLEGAFPDVVHSFVYFFGVWEPAITAVFRAALRPGDVVIDIGANVGLHSLLAARLVGPSGRVHAIEASPWIFARLLRNLAANDAHNVTVYNKAVTASAGPVPVYLHESSNLGGTTIMASEAARSGARLEAMVEGLTLADIVPMEAILAARLIKIDVEGAEWLVLQGMADLLPKLRHDVEILVEVKRDALVEMGASIDALIGLFGAAGFSAFEAANDYGGNFYIRHAPAPPVPFIQRDFDMADLVFRRARPGE